MGKTARPDQQQVLKEDDHQNITCAADLSHAKEPIYLRHRFNGGLGQLLRDYYADVVEQPIPEGLLQLVEQFRSEEQNK